MVDRFDLVTKGDFYSWQKMERDPTGEWVRAEDYDALRARVANLEAAQRVAATLLRDYEADAHPEDVGEVTRWLAVYDSQQQRATESASVAPEPKCPKCGLLQSECDNQRADDERSPPLV
jgi:hypothetical protein